MNSRGPAARGRDRHGRGMRGPLHRGGPGGRTRRATFDDLVTAAVDYLEHRWPEELRRIDFAVEDVPPVPPEDDEWVAREGIPLGRVEPADRSAKAVVVVYRRPIELRAGDAGELADLVHDVVVEQLARLLGMDPETVDPSYGGDW